MIPMIPMDPALLGFAEALYQEFVEATMHAFDAAGPVIARQAAEGPPGMEAASRHFYDTSMEHRR